ncbi:MAG: glutathione peroxidase [Paludibacteraceae bacterium]|nr:glutathione peroxidase [Paludibacteraceae bacterium]
MKKCNLIFIAIVVLSLLGIFFLKASGSETISEGQPTTTVYDFTVIDNQGNEVSLSQYKGKVLLIVNTATRCGHTPQYEELQQLYSVYKDKGFEILDFPCNQFAEQAPESDEEIQNFCTLNYHTEFPRFHKIDVNGENKIALYDYLEHANVDDPAADVSIGWNFTKFLVGKDGKVIRRFETDQRKDIIEPAIIDALN